MIPADHPDLDRDRVNQILMTKEDQDLLTEICLDPLSSETMCRYAAYLVTDVASHRKAMHGPPESQIVGRVVEREVPINSYHIRHGWSASGGETLDQDNYIGMPVPVSFDKNIGIRKEGAANGHQRRLVNRCKCDHASCKCVGSAGVRPQSKKATVRMQSRDLNAQKINQRKELYKKYTRVDPEINHKVKKEVINGSRKAQKSKERYFEPKKYVIEQIAAIGNIHRSPTIRKTHMVSIEDTTERLAHIKPMTPSRDSMMTRIRSETVTEPSAKIPVLEEMVELMDLYMRSQPQAESVKKPAPTASTNHMSVQTNHEERRAGVQLYLPKSATKKTKVNPSTKSESDYKVVIAKQSRVIKEPASQKRVVKIVNRHYELDTDSFEVSELIQHVPSRVFSLESPVVKQTVDVHEDDDLLAIDRSKYTAVRGELVDQDEMEVEKRKMIERVVDDFEVPVFIRK